MALSKTVTVDKIEVQGTGALLIRTKTLIAEDGNVLSKSFERTSKTPGDNVSDMDQRVQEIAALVWTPECIAAWNQTQAELRAMEIEEDV